MHYNNKDWLKFRLEKNTIPIYNNLIFTKYLRYINNNQSCIFSIYLNDYLNTYKSWKYISGLAINGQRTKGKKLMYNKTNNLILLHKFKYLFKFYNKLNQINFYKLYKYEKFNLIYKFNWIKQWFENYKKIIKKFNNKKLIVPNTIKECIGFQRGFTKKF